MKNQALFSSKDKSKKLKCPLLQFLFGALRVKDSIKSLSPALTIFLWNKVFLLIFVKSFLLPNDTCIHGSTACEIKCLICLVQCGN